MHAAEIPPGVQLESVWLAEIPYTSEAPDRRPAVRPEHLSRVARLLRAGTLIEVGGCTDWSKAVLIFRAPDEATVRRLVEEDIYTASGVWGEARITGYGRVVVTED